ncbi:CapA family protein [Bacteroides sp. 51]|uniref:CapA family protein n=1 Tax=Bacteroides sp. 51 TaxID=2302938 RepID=UPI00351B18BF
MQSLYLPKSAAYRLINAGADILIGHHPHVLQEEEIYKDKPIFIVWVTSFLTKANPGLPSLQSYRQHLIRKALRARSTR